MRRVDAGPSGASAAALSVSGLAVHFGGVVALHDVSIEMHPHEIHGVIGPNGAGKTTLFNAICRLATPSGGSITYGGRSLLSMRPSQLAGLGIVRTLQGLGLWTAADRARERHARRAARRPACSPTCSALPRADRRERSRADAAMAVLDELGIADRARRVPGLAAPRRAEARRAGTGAGRATVDAAARRARQRAVGRRGGAARRAAARAARRHGASRSSSTTSTW